jgi:hypothetical protein
MLVVAGASAVIAAVGGAAIAGAFGDPDHGRPRVGSATAAHGTHRPRTVLVLTQTYGYRHASIPAAAAAIRQLGSADHRLRFVFLPGAQSLTPSRLRSAAAVMFLLTTGELPLSPSGKRDLLAFVHGGGALIGFHSATDTFHGWPAYIRLIGAEFATHAPPSTQRIIIEDRHNPATRLLPARFAIHEEFYEFRHDPRPRGPAGCRTVDSAAATEAVSGNTEAKVAAARSRTRLCVLARLDTGSGGPDRPLVWCRRDGGGRVFYDALGHFDQTWRDSRQLDLARGGIDWAVGLAPGRC